MHGPGGGPIHRSLPGLGIQRELEQALFGEEVIEQHLLIERDHAVVRAQDDEGVFIRPGQGFAYDGVHPLVHLHDFSAQQLALCLGNGLVPVAGVGEIRQPPAALQHLVRGIDILDKSVGLARG